MSLGSPQRTYKPSTKGIKHDNSIEALVLERIPKYTNYRATIEIQWTRNSNMANLANPGGA